MSFDSNAYNITIRRAVVEGGVLFEARVKELPDVVEYAESYDEAYDLAIDTIDATFAGFSDQGKEMPSPVIPVDDCSGRVTLRMPKSLHNAISENANSEGVSLNHYIVSILAYSSGFSRGQRSALDSPWRLVPKTLGSDLPNPLKHKETQTQSV